MKVSVIIPVYNAVLFVDRCIQSALDQPQTGEVILIDDRSTDGSWEKCEVWKNKDERVKIFKNEGVKGAGAARNVGLKNATCDFIAFLDADDFFLENRFEVTKEIFETDNTVDGVAESVAIRSNSDQKQITELSGVFLNHQTVGFKNSYTHISLNDFLFESTFLITGLTIKKKTIELVGNFDESLKQTQDTDFILRLLRNTNIRSGLYEKIVSVYNLHENNSIHNFYEAAYFRRKLYKKHTYFTLKQPFQLKLLYYYFIRFIEYDYILLNSKIAKNKKLTKFFLLPYFTYRLFSKNDPPYDTNRTIRPI